MIFIVTALTGCAGKQQHPEYDQYLTAENYKAAYEYCVTYLKDHPDDGEFQQRLVRLGGILYDISMADGDTDLNGKRYLSALDSFANALKYKKDDPGALRDQQQAQSAYDGVGDLFARASTHKGEGRILDALKLLNTIADRYDFKGDRADEMNLAEHMDTWHIQGFNSHVARGTEAHRDGRYNAYLEAFTSAVCIMNLSHAPEEIKNNKNAPAQLELAGRFVAADHLFQRARENYAAGNSLKMMADLIQAREIIDGHLELNLFYGDVLPPWSEEIFNKGTGLIAEARFDEALEYLKMLWAVNPAYPGTENRLATARLEYLKQNYRLMINARTGARETYDFQSVLDYGEKIRREDPEFLDTTDIMTRVAMEAFDLFYRKGIYFKDRKAYAKALLCFSSAESFLGKNGLTTELLNDMVTKIRGSVVRKIAVWDFNQEVGDIRTGIYTASEIRSQWKNKNNGRTFKNIHLYLEPLTYDDQIHDSVYADEGDFNWDLFKSRGNSQNTLVAGAIKLLKAEKSKSTSWKEWQHEKESYGINPAYARLDARQAELYRLLGNKREMSNAKRTAVRVKDELKEVQAELKATPQMIMCREKVITPYQEETHRIKVDTRIEVQILKDNRGMESSKLWDTVVFNDTLVEEDTVIPPDINSTDPKKRQGDPLNLPTDLEIKQQAVARLIAHKVIPDLQAKIDAYGIRFYTAGSRDGISISSKIENYYKFLACYDSTHSPHPELIDEVNTYLEDNIADLWLIRH